MQIGIILSSFLFRPFMLCTVERKGVHFFVMVGSVQVFGYISMFTCIVFVLYFKNAKKQVFYCFN